MTWGWRLVRLRLFGRAVYRVVGKNVGKIVDRTLDAIIANGERDRIWVTFGPVNLTFSRYKTERVIITFRSSEVDVSVVSLSGLDKVFAAISDSLEKYENLEAITQDKLRWTMIFRGETVQFDIKYGWASTHRLRISTADALKAVADYAAARKRLASEMIETIR